MLRDLGESVGKDPDIGRPRRPLKGPVGNGGRSCAGYQGRYLGTQAGGLLPRMPRGSLEEVSIGLLVSDLTRVLYKSLGSHFGRSC